ncbi:EutN/CcmL family microcompartment protein [Melioribacter sp. OK-6-Me]|uniref:EutN/CcmL family microcompartment protein n=1 Tax=unclassified Melioribacter TaxID=2627329 RepID=UPI003EDA4482
MYLAKVTKKIVSVVKHEAYNGKKVYVVRPVLPDGTILEDEHVALDYIGAGVGDIVVCGGAPGVAQSIFGLNLAPIRTLIIAIVDKIDYNKTEL